jgi:cell division initiation protein
MPVTPEDIQNKEFREAFRGYNQDDVDTFLDEVALEFARLHQENQRMKVQLAALQQEIARLGERPVGGPAGPAAARAREEEARIQAARAAAEAALEEARRRAAELVARAEQRAREIDELTARRAKDVDADTASALADAQRRVAELRRQEAEIRRRLRAFLTEQLATLDAADLEAAPPAARSPVVERMSRELGGDRPVSAPQGAAGEPFWRGG